MPELKSSGFNERNSKKKQNSYKPPKKKVKRKKNKNVHSRTGNSGANNKHKQIKRGQNNKKQNYKSKQKKKQNNIIYYCMFAFLFVVLTSILSVTVLFNAREITIKGDSIYSDNEILNAVEIKDGVNLIRYNPSTDIEKILQKLVYLDSVEIHKVYPSKLTIEVKGAEKMAAVLLDDGSYLIISKNGRILERTNENKDGQIVIKGYEPVSIEIGSFIKSETERKDELVYKLISEIEKTEIIKITEIDIEDYLYIVLNYDNRISLIIGPPTELTAKLMAAKKIIDEGIGETEIGKLNLLSPTKGTFSPDIVSDAYSLFGDDSESDGEDSDNDEEQETNSDINSE